MCLQDVFDRFSTVAGSMLMGVGDWTGKGYNSIEVYILSSGFFCLRNSNAPGPCDISLSLGASGDNPVVGDWFSQGFDTVGVWIPTYGFFCLRNSNAGGSCDIALNFGSSEDTPVVGDTTGQLNEFGQRNIKIDTLGVWIGSSGWFCLRNSNVNGPCDVATQFCSSADTPSWRIGSLRVPATSLSSAFPASTTC
jgi:endoglucanase